MKNSFVIILSILLATMPIQGCSSHHFVQKDYSGEVSYKISFLKDYASGLYFLEFNGNGILSNPEEVLRAIHDIKTNRDEIDKIIIVSVGWGYSRSEAYEKYASLLKNYLHSVEEKTSPHVSASNGLSPELTEIEKNRLKRSVIFCISWDSGLLGVRQLVNDVIPSKPLSDTISLIPQAVFPLTFWAKSDLAERIGQGELRLALEEIIDEVYSYRDVAVKIPDIYFVGHSFGARILNSVIYTDINFGYGVASKTPFKYMDSIKGVVYVLPAILNAYVKSSENKYPTVIIQSEYDRANNYLFPIANIPFDGKYGTVDWKCLKPSLKDNRFNFASGELTEKQLHDIKFSMSNIGEYVRRNFSDNTLDILFNSGSNHSSDFKKYVIANELDKVVNGHNLLVLLDGDFSIEGIDKEQKNYYYHKDSRCINRAIISHEYGMSSAGSVITDFNHCPDRTIEDDKWTEFLKILFGVYEDAILIPASIASSSATFGLNYICAQIWEIISRNINYPFDTLAQIPVIKLPIQGLEEFTVLITGHKPSWGLEHKGIFDFGIFKESATSSVSSVLNVCKKDNKYKIQDFLNTTVVAKENNVICIDASNIIKDGSKFFGIGNLGTYDMSGMFSSLFGIVDPIGSHQNFEKDEVFKVIDMVLHDKVKLYNQH